MRTIVAAAAIIVALSSCRAHAHGEAAWIQANPNFVDRAKAHCCGAHDCEPAQWWDFDEQQDGIVYVPSGEKLLYGKPDGERGGIYWSDEPKPAADQRWFVCRRKTWFNGNPQPDLKCIFRPQPKS